MVVLRSKNLSVQLRLYEYNQNPKTMKNCLLILTLIAFGCNSNQQNTDQSKNEGKENNCFIYPKIVDSLQIKDLYDSARWYVYTWHCDQNYLPKSDSLKSVTFGELPLKFNNLSFKQDTLEMNFDFIDESEPYPILPSMTRDNKQFLSGVGFNTRTKQKIYKLSPNGFSTTIKGGANRYENPLQPEVLAYIKSNWNKLNSCFKELAKQKGIMK